MERVQNLTQAYSQAPWRRQMQIAGLFLTALVFSALVAGVYLNVTARAATIGREIQRMQAEIDAIQQDNANLQSSLAFITSAGEMEKRALSMGFRPIERDEAWFIVVPDYNHRRPAVLAPTARPVRSEVPEMPAVYLESLFDWLARQMRRSALPWFSLKVLP